MSWLQTGPCLGGSSADFLGAAHVTPKERAAGSRPALLLHLGVVPWQVPVSMGAPMHTRTNTGKGQTFSQKSLGFTAWAHLAPARPPAHKHLQGPAVPTTLPGQGGSGSWKRRRGGACLSIPGSTVAVPHGTVVSGQ